MKKVSDRDALTLDYIETAGGTNEPPSRVGHLGG